jgi:transcriptional regulator with XRE-family HTH domain
VATWSKEVLAKNLKRYMDRAGKTQREMADIVGVSAPTFSDWINAKKYPRIDKIEIMADYFGILKSDLIEDKTAEEKEKSTAADDGLSKSKKELMDFVRTLPEESVQVLLQVARSIKQ